MSRTATRVVAAICYLVALAGQTAFGLFVLLLGADLWPWAPLFTLSSPYPLNLAWLLLFAVQHSGMLRERFKQFWTRLVPLHLERSIYAAVAGVLLLALPAVWQPVPGEAWWRLPRLFILVPLFAGAMLMWFGTWIDHAALFGWRQATAEADRTPERLLVAGPYRFVRHPLYAGTLVFLWSQPVMTPTLGLLVVGLSAYIGLGLLLEERDLLRRFGPSYAAYRRRVPCLLPWRWPASPEEIEVQA